MEKTEPFSISQKIGIIADDLTGAGDAIAPFTRRVGQTAVLLYPHVPEELLRDLRVIAIDTDTRQTSAEEARERSGASAQFLQKVVETSFLYVKVDSTLRGHPGACIDGVMQATESQLALVCLAFPQEGRTTREGRQYLNDLPLEETPLKEDPAEPVRESYIPAVLARETKRKISVLSLRQISRSPTLIYQRLNQPSWRDGRIVVADAKTEGDLITLANIVVHSSPGILPAGAGGFAGALASELRLSYQPTVMEAFEASRTLVVAGSINPTTLLQVESLRRREVERLGLPLKDFLEGRLPDWDTLRRRMNTGFLKMGVVILAWDNLENIPPALLSPPKIREVGSLLGQLVRHIVEEFQIDSLILSGGVTARSVCEALGAYGMRMRDEIFPGIPESRLLGGPFDGLIIVTKPGGFGAGDTLIRIVEHLRGARL